MVALICDEKVALAIDRHALRNDAGLRRRDVLTGHTEIVGTREPPNNSLRVYPANIKRVADVDIAGRVYSYSMGISDGRCARRTSVSGKASGRSDDSRHYSAGCDFFDHVPIGVPTGNE